MLSYISHLTHILQSPDVVLNKPTLLIVDKKVHNKPIISGNNNISRTAFMAITDHTVKTVCTKENVLKAF